MAYLLQYLLYIAVTFVLSTYYLCIFLCFRCHFSRVRYNNLGDIADAVRGLNPTVLKEFDTSCFDGRYVTEVTQEYLEVCILSLITVVKVFNDCRYRRSYNVPVNSCSRWNKAVAVIARGLLHQISMP